MADIVDFLPQVIQECPGCPDPTAELAILNTLREICADTGYWREEQIFSLVTDESATGEYTLTVSEGQVLESVISPNLNAKSTPSVTKSV